MGESNKLSREFLAERDLRIFNLKKSGLSNVDIGKRFNMSAAAVAAASRRVLGRLNSEAFLSYPEVLRLELERLDEMQKSMWPLTQFRRETLDDGSEIMLEPDQNAVRTVLGIMDRRAKLLGMNVERTEVAISGLESQEVIEVQSSLAGQVREVSSGDDAKDDALALLEPDQNAVRTVLGIMDRRAKLLGMNVERTEVAISGLESQEVIEVQSSLAGQVREVSSGDDAKDDALALLELMASSGVLDQGVVSNILDNVSDDELGTPLDVLEETLDSPVIEAEIVSEEIDQVIDEENE